MSIEQLQLILNTLTGLGAEAKTVAIVWLLVQHALGPILSASVIVYVARLLFRAVTANIGLSASEEALCRWRDKLAIGHPGVLIDTERAAVIARIDTLIAKSQEGAK